MPPEPTPWYDERPAVLNFVAPAGMVSLGDGDYYDNVNESFQINIDASSRNDVSACLVAATVSGSVVSYDLSNASIANGVIGDTPLTNYVGGGTLANRAFIDFSMEGSSVLANITIPDGLLYGILGIYANNGGFARIALGTDDRSIIAQLLDIPLPLCARGDGDTDLQITVNGESPNKWAGWQSALPAGAVAKIKGFNLPRQITSYSGATPTTINAEGGDYGIEFTIPQDSDSVAIFDETFWLYIR